MSNDVTDLALELNELQEALDQAEKEIERLQVQLETILDRLHEMVQIGAKTLEMKAFVTEQGYAGTD